MKKIAIILLLAFIAGAMALAQEGQKHFNPEEFRARLEAFITSEAGFTDDEAQTFYPIYHEMKNKQRNIQYRIFKIKKENCKAEGEKDYIDIIKTINCLNKRKAHIQEQYYQKMCEAVPAQKVFKAMLAEDRFHRQALEEAHKKN